MSWTRYDWLSRGLLLLGLWFIASGSAGLLVPEHVLGAGGSLPVGLILSGVTTVVGIGAVLAGLYLFSQYVEEESDLALSARQVAERWDQR
ncbi:hypothetical protein ACFPYI_09395 [Halomarina salina]|uniref:DUF485 domain-containing protein n=1 Tax=Halomarina salina TaxID=1872699 RepID=A0ABD5RML8_9EURY|nr:hypothetical protein [Halomarina salina]